MEKPEATFAKYAIEYTIPTKRKRIFSRLKAFITSCSILKAFCVKIYDHVKTSNCKYCCNCGLFKGFYN